MKKLFISLLLVVSFSATELQAQTTNTNSDTAAIKIGKEATFPGGAEGWRKYLEANLNADLASKYIKLKKNQKLAQQTVALQFIVEKTGQVRDVVVTNPQEVHKKLAAEAIRVIQEGPKWIPAEIDGKKVVYQVKQYITYQVGEE